MKKTKFFKVALAAAVLSLSACNNEEVLTQESEIQLTSEITDSRVVSQNLQSTQIVTGQQVGVFIDGAKSTHNNVKWVAGANGVLTTATPAYWGNGNVTITAYHPYNASCDGSPYTFSIKTDQSSDANYLNSDLLWATTTAAKTNNPVSLTFGHVLSKITVSLTGDNIADLSGATVSICGTKTSGLFSPMSSDLSNLSSEAEIVAGVTASNAYTASAIILPQQVNSGTKFVKVSHNNKTYHYALSENKNFQRGYSYNFNLKITAAGLVGLSTSITDWNNETISGELVEDADNNNQQGASYYANGIAYVANGGALSSIIPENEKLTITSLKITGSLNSDDIRFIREMAGGTFDYSWSMGNGMLETLDISECTIVAGGSPFGKHTWEENGYVTSDNRFGNYAFAQTNLKHVSLPVSVNVLDDCILSNCPKLESVDIPDNVTQMKSYIFGGSGLLTSVTLPKNLEFFCESTFNGCHSLQTISIDNSNRYFYINADGVLYGYSDAYSNQAILYCSPAASSTTDVTVKDGTTKVGTHSFSYCKSLKNVTIPATVTEIGDDAFSSCSSMEKITILCTTPPRIDYTIYDSAFDTYSPGSAFDDINMTFKIYVPSNLLDIYKEAWKDIKVSYGYNENKIETPVVNYLQAIVNE